MRLGVVCSAGGSAVFAALDLLEEAGAIAPESVLVVTDRACGAEDQARARGIAQRRFDEADPARFSAAAADCLAGEGCDAALLLFSRLVTPALFDRVPSFNLHPSLLPAFPGFGALAAARKAGVRMVGCTLHRVDAGTDSGPIVAQVASPAPSGGLADLWDRVSFVQKAYLACVLVDLWPFPPDPSPRTTASASPALRSPGLISAFGAFLSARPETVLVP
jgi:phosphoribosylglycinamide formyltransferase-1